MDCTTKLNTWVELELIIDRFIAHKLNKYGMLIEVARLIERHDEVDIKEFQLWCKGLKEENEFRRKTGYNELPITKIMRNAGGGYSYF